MKVESSLNAKSQRHLDNLQISYLNVNKNGNAKYLTMNNDESIFIEPCPCHQVIARKKYIYVNAVIK